MTSEKSEKSEAISAAPLCLAEPYIIEQDVSAYTQEQHDTWAELVRRILPELEKHAAQEYLDGFEIIGLQKDLLPNLKSVSARLAPRTGWSSTPVSGFLPAPAFFEMLSSRRFPTTTWLRGRDSLEYTPQPDIFHDVFGHVPMHAHPVFADFLERYGRVCAATSSVGALKFNALNVNTLERLGRIFWYTVEFGVIRQAGAIKVYGSGLISSDAERRNVVEGRCIIHDFSLEEVLNTPVKVDEVHSLLFAVDSFDQVYDAMHEAERRAVASCL